ncbi:TetR/AcrR family transcriptional regulator [Mycolicibacterium rufum]|uniref:TetR/AcrR family transcriptional regulator n=1 Tax=Mycolicibacterium rufum TaxID=318424 RepID=A0ABY3UL13_9MYCO|nr:TetR/AcrR family transcriptional regulator [Mycolicibacterium rufum]ULP38976.1 TetR/AcrR family transcriptional regulator [Mycolicibacterium rufum]
MLRATSALIEERGLRAMTTDDIAGRSGVSKATIYKWWPNKYAVAVDAFLSAMDMASTDPDTGLAHNDFQIVLRGIMEFYRGPGGRTFAQLIGEAQNDSAIATELRNHLMQTRRDIGRTIWDRGVARGELRPDIDREIAVDLVFGPALYRLLTTDAALDDAAADAIVDAAMRGLSAM